MLRRVPARSSLILLAALLSACTGSPSSSGLEARGAATPVPAATPTPTKVDTKADTKVDTKADAKAEPETPPAPDVAPGQLTAQPPAGTELLPVHLALKDASVYQVTTIGMVAFTSVQPSGFAREERVELDQCTGEGAARRCRVTNTHVRFAGEPPNGRIFEADEQKVDKLTTRHTLLASGAREGVTEVSGDAEQLASPDGKALAEVHRFYCIRFPDVPIGVGAKWKDVCHLRTGGVVDTREVIWELTNIGADDKGRRRAEFTYLGRYTAPSDKGDRTGTVQGILYYLLDAGEPHLLKEQITTRRGEAKAFSTTTTIDYQFARLIKDKKGKETAVRTDGEPFPPEAAPAPAPTKAAPPAPMSPAPAP